MPETYYKENEVYLTEEAVKNAGSYAKAEIVYYLIKRLLDNGQSKDGVIGVTLSKCAGELEPAVI